LDFSAIGRVDYVVNAPKEKEVTNAGTKARQSGSSMKRRQFLKSAALVGAGWTDLRSFSSVPSTVRPKDLLRMEVCLNGDWEVVQNCTDEIVPEKGWEMGRAPAMPLARNPPITSLWYKCMLEIPGSWDKANRRFFLRLEKAGHYAGIYWNGRRVAENYGHDSPFEADVTEALRLGEKDEIAIFVHNASGKFARPGVVLTDPMEGNAYRGATAAEYQRNWTGIAGNIFLGWRPVGHISDVFVIPSVRGRRLKVDLEIEGVGSDRSEVMLRFAILENGKVIRRLPEIAVHGKGPISVEEAWPDPVLWGPEPYGKTMLYVLRAEIFERGVLVDRLFTRFGFREVWIEGRDLLLNGKKLWMTGTYFHNLSPVRYLNDRHSQAPMIEIMQGSGINTLHGHWDSLGDAWLDLCDEMNMFVVAGFFCDGRPNFQSVADPGLADWMAATCSQWVRSVRNHPSIVIWRPTDDHPRNLAGPHGVSPAIVARMGQEVRQADGTRPLADGTDIQTWAQASLKNLSIPGDYDDCSRMAQALAASERPFLTKELYTPFQDTNGVSDFIKVFCEKAFAGGSVGFIVQDIPLIRWTKPFRIAWLSQSGEGNRDFAGGIDEENLPNWCDSSQPCCAPTPYNELFAGLYRQFIKLPLPVSRHDVTGEVLLSNLSADEIVLLVPEDPALKGPLGIRAAADGTAWIVALQPGAYRLHSRTGSVGANIHARPREYRPGYNFVQRITLPSRPAVSNLAR
jgi:Glycosyl hydrolases family 2, sugar binding domain/Glycosyl hydrolases family 2, TIM barrel domain/Glycosyl hydrolases family 2